MADYDLMEFAGGAVDTTLSGSLSSGETGSFAIADATGWPTGGTGNFAVTITQQSTEERILCASRSGTTVTIAASGRGWDGTSAATFTSGATVIHSDSAHGHREANKAAHETVGKVTTAGDLLVADGANSLGRLAKGANSTFFGVTSGGVQSYRKVAAADVDADIATQAELDTHAADTTSVHGITDTSVLATDSEVATAVSDHAADTTSVHGIADTSALETSTGAQTKVDTHAADTTSVHGITNTATVPRGVLGYAEVTVDQAGISSETDITNATVTFTPEASRRVKLTAWVRFQKITNAGTIDLRIKEGAAEIATAGHGPFDASEVSSIPLWDVIEPTAAAHTYKLTIAASSASVTVLDSRLLAEDIGSA